MSERTTSWAGWRLLLSDLARRRRALVWLAAWSVVESLPVLVSGVCVAAALDHGFLDHRPLVGLGWLGLLGLTMVVGAIATRATFRWLPDIVEPLRDLLLTTVVTGALHRAAHSVRGDEGAAVARLSGQAETIRNLVAALLRALRSTVVGMVLALVGLVTLAPIVAGMTAPLLLLSLALFCWSMRTLAARHRAMMLAEEQMSGTSTRIFAGVRDVVAAVQSRLLGRQWPVRSWSRQQQGSRWHVQRHRAPSFSRWAVTYPSCCCWCWRRGCTGRAG